VGKGATGSAFLKVPISARATAMGGAFTAVDGDVSSMEYNPAGLAEIYRTDASATYLRYIEDSKFQSLSVGFPIDFKKGSNLGEGFFGPDSGKIFIGLHYRSFQAVDTVRADADHLGTPGGDFDIKDQLIHLGLAYSPFERLSIGLGGKIISSKLAGVSMSNFATDAGFLWKYSAVTTLGASLLNVGSDKAYISSPDPLPTTLRTGLSFQMKRFLVTTDVLTGRDKITQEALGVEASPNSLLRLRGGIINDTTFEYAAGIGLLFSPSSNKLTPAEHENKENKSILDEMDVSHDNPVYQKYGASSSPPIDLEFDYAFRTHGDLDATHTITIKMLY
jgi:hypothetical protein